jgi:hypothetical protein
MTDMAQGLSANTDTSPSTPVSSPAPAETQRAPEERTFRQSEVTDIVKRERHEAVDKFRRQQVEQPQYVAQKYGDVGIHPPQPVQSGLDENQYRRIAAEEAQRLRDVWVQDAQTKHQEDMAHRTVQNFQAKVTQGKEKYSDFEKVIGDIEFASFPNVVQLLGDHIENGHDVLYELGKDLAKMEILESMAMRSPRAAILQAQRLAASLKANEEAGNVKMPREPLSQLRPSNTGLDSGAMSVSDYRKKYRV